MEDKEIFERISSDPDILHGKPFWAEGYIPYYFNASLPS
jgi:hypothetical protein